MHHVALRVDDIEAALAHCAARGIRLIDEQPRPGAEGALVAFIHPSAAHGVLVELKQPAPRVELFTTAGRHTLGDLELITLSDGFFGLDGGAMFGVVPRTFWEKRLPPDDANRIPLGMRPLIVRDGKTTLLIDAGCGDKMDAEERADLQARSPLSSRSFAGRGRAVGRRHRHRASPATCTSITSAALPRSARTARSCRGFRSAKYIAHRGEWEDATHPHERNRASYLQENFVPLQGRRRAHAGRRRRRDHAGRALPALGRPHARITRW